MSQERTRCTQRINYSKTNFNRCAEEQEAGVAGSTDKKGDEFTMDDASLLCSLYTLEFLNSTKSKFTCFSDLLSTIQNQIAL